MYECITAHLITGHPILKVSNAFHTSLYYIYTLNNKGREVRGHWTSSKEDTGPSIITRSTSDWAIILLPTEVRYVSIFFLTPFPLAWWLAQVSKPFHAGYCRGGEQGTGDHQW